MTAPTGDEMAAMTDLLTAFLTSNERSAADARTDAHDLLHDSASPLRLWLAECDREIKQLRDEAENTDEILHQIAADLPPDWDGDEAELDLIGRYVTWSQGEAERLRGQVADALANHDHADTCGTALSPGEGYPCNCWRAALAEDGDRS